MQRRKLPNPNHSQKSDAQRESWRHAVDVDAEAAQTRRGGAEGPRDTGAVLAHVQILDADARAQRRAECRGAWAAPVQKWPGHNTPPVSAAAPVYNGPTGVECHEFAASVRHPVPCPLPESHIAVVGRPAKPKSLALTCRNGARKTARWGIR